jgi:peptidoglycan/xylan/chitin deacetylase (PgdA/CDA1 family)
MNDSERQVAVLAYHRLGDAPPGDWNDWFYVHEDDFAEHLQFLARMDWSVITLSDLIIGLVNPSAIPPRSVLITFDDADATLVSVGLPQLRRFGLPAVVFVPTKFVGGTNSFDAGNQPPERICSWEDLSELARHDVSIQAHSVSHRPFTELGLSDIQRELRSCKAILEDRLNHHVEAFAYPFGDMGSDPSRTEGVLLECGYRAAFLYGGRCPWPLTGVRRFCLPRLAMGRDTDLAAELGSGVGQDA